MILDNWDIGTFDGVYFDPTLRFKDSVNLVFVAAENQNIVSR
jgi:hypothetical protein